MAAERMAVLVNLLQVQPVAVVVAAVTQASRAVAVD